MNEQISPVDTDKISAIKGSGAMLADTFYPDLTPEIIMFPAKQMLKLFKQWQKNVSACSIWRGHKVRQGIMV